MTAWIFAPILATATWHLLAFATLTQALWSRYPSWLLNFARCPACAGTWYTAGWYFLLSTPGFGSLSYLGSLFVAGLWGTFWVPLLGWLHYRALTTLYGEPDESEENGSTSDD